MLSFSWRIIINFSLARKNNWHGTFIPSPSPASVVFLLQLQFFYNDVFCQTSKNRKRSLQIFLTFQMGDGRLRFHLFLWQLLHICPVYLLVPWNLSITIDTPSHDRISSNFTSTASISFFFENIFLLPRELWNLRTRKSNVSI